MVKNDHLKQKSKVTASNVTPIFTRGAARSQPKIHEDNSASASSRKADRSHSICSGDCFELMEKRLAKTLRDMLSEKFEEFDERMAKFEDRLSQEMQAVVDTTQADMGKINTEVEHLKNELAEVRCEMDNIYRHNRLSDAIITGIPTCKNEDPQQILTAVAARIGHNLSPYATAFRPRSSSGKRNKPGKSAPIVVKFSSVAEQRQFISKYRGNGSMPLNSISTEFVSDSRVNVFESLTPRNNKLLRYALKLNRDGRIHAAFTRHGIVYIRIAKTEAPIEIATLDALKDIVTIDEADDAMA